MIYNMIKFLQLKIFFLILKYNFSLTIVEQLNFIIYNLDDENK